MTRAIYLAALCVVLIFLQVLIACQREDGLPDPPPRELVPCVPDAGAGDPLSCPPLEDAGVSAEDLL